MCVLRLENVFTMDQQSEKNIIRVERRMSWVDEDDDVKISSEGTDQTTWTCASDCIENSPSSPLNYIDLPIITALNLDYVHSSL